MSEINGKLSTSSFTADSAVGRRILISHGRSKKLFQALIIKYDHITDRHVIKFDNDEREEQNVSLSKETFEWIGQPDVASDVDQRAQKQDQRESTNMEARKNGSVGRRFEYRTKKGKRKNFQVVGYNKESGIHRVRCENSNKVKKIDLGKLQNVTWLDVLSVLPHVKQRQTNHKSSKCIGVQFLQQEKLWMALAPLKQGGPRKKYIGLFTNEKDASLAHDYYARKIGCDLLNFEDECIDQEEINKRRSVHGLIKPSVDGGCKYRGVYWHKIRMLWMARLSTKVENSQRQITFGAFLDPIHCALAFDNEARKQLRKAEVLNFPDVVISNKSLINVRDRANEKRINNKETDQDNHNLYLPLNINETENKEGNKSSSEVESAYLNEEKIETDVETKRKNEIDHILLSNNIDKDDEESSTYKNQKKVGMSTRSRNISKNDKHKKEKETDTIAISSSKNLLELVDTPLVDVDETNIRINSVEIEKETIESNQEKVKKKKKIETERTDSFAGIDNGEKDNVCTTRARRKRASISTDKSLIHKTKTIQPNQEKVKKKKKRKIETECTDSFAGIDSGEQDNVSNGARRKRARISTDKSLIHKTKVSRNKETTFKGSQPLCKKSTKRTDTFDLSTLKVGDRTAFDFGKDVYFGSIVKCHVMGKKKFKWFWKVIFDDGEVYEFDYKDMLKGTVLYQDFKEREINDPSTEKRLRKIKDDFLSKKNTALAKIPDKVKSQFLQAGFASWRGEYRPVLFLGPYDVMPGPVRDRWFRAFQKLKSGRDIQVPQIVYWFGHKQLSSAFSILTSKDCISYEMGIKKELHIKYQTKDKQVYNEMMEVISKPLYQRRPISDFKEEYELVVGPKADRLLVEIEAEQRQKSA